MVGRLGLHRVARWLVVPITGFAVALSAGLVWQVVIFDRKGFLLGFHSSDVLIPFLFFIVGLSALAWLTICAAVLLPDLRLIGRWLAARLCRKSENVEDLATYLA